MNKQLNDGNFEFMYHGLIDLFTQHYRDLHTNAEIVYKFNRGWGMRRRISFRKARRDLPDLLLAQQLQTRGVLKYFKRDFGPLRNRRFERMIPLMEVLSWENSSLLTKLKTAIANSESGTVGDMMICTSLLTETNELIYSILQMLRKEDNEATITTTAIGENKEVEPPKISQ
jgi:hypothetical protein